MRVDDDDDDDEVKTSMIVRVHHISSWSCGFDDLRSALQPTTWRTTMNGLFVFQRLFQTIVDPISQFRQNMARRPTAAKL